MTNTNLITQELPAPSINSVADTLTGILHWDDLEQIWHKVLKAVKTDWYLYTPETPLPDSFASTQELQALIAFLKTYLPNAQAKDYCGIAYVDSKSDPSLIRIFDPKALTSMCNIGGHVPAPSWVITTLDPTHLAVRKEPPSNLQRFNLGKNIPLPEFPPHPQADDTLDARRMGCPLPLVNTSLALKHLAIGEVLEVITFEPGAVNDIECICDCTGHKHLALAEGSYGYSFYVQRMHTQK